MPLTEQSVGAFKGPEGGGEGTFSMQLTCCLSMAVLCLCLTHLTWVVIWAHGFTPDGMAVGVVLSPLVTSPLARSSEAAFLGRLYAVVGLKE